MSQSEWTVDLNAIRALNVLLEHESVTGAARQLGISQPAASATLARLRRQFDEPLLVRRGRGLVRTEYGSELLHRTREFMAATAKVVAPAEFDPLSVVWNVRIATSDHMAEQLVRLLRGGLAEAVGVTVAFVPLGGDVFDQLARGEIDLFVGPRFPSRHGYHVATVLTESYACLRRAPTTMTPLDLETYLAAGHVQVRPLGRAGGATEAALRDLGLERRIVWAVPTFWLAARLVADADLIATMPTDLAKHFAEIFGLDVAPPPLRLEPLEIVAHWHDRHDRDARHSWFRSILGNHVEAPHPTCRPRRPAGEKV